MSFQSQTFEEAKAAYKPMARTPMKRRTGIRSSAIPYGVNGLGARKVKAKKKVKKLSDGKLKKKVWTEFSIFIRTRGADEDGINQCVTCDVKKHWKELQAGHFLRGRLNANLFSEIGTNPQCYGCNVGKQGEVVIYYRWMAENHGEAAIDELIAQNNKTHKWAPGELLEKLEHYRTLNNANPLVERKTKSPRADG